MFQKGKVESVQISQQKKSYKRAVESIAIDENGVVGDIHAGKTNKQISLLLKKNLPNDFANVKSAENITISGIDITAVRVLDRFKIAEVLLEVTQVGKKCEAESCNTCLIKENCKMLPACVYCRVVDVGKVQSGDVIEHRIRKLKVKIITLSDRAFAGKYADLSGALAYDRISNFLHQQNWQADISNVILPDDAAQLEVILKQSITEKTDIVFALGGTGIGPRDITSEVVLSVCEKTIPGIMEYIRMKYGAIIPSALLSRSVAGISQETQIYALPGSVKAVQEYLTEIFRTLEHAVFMLRAIDH